VLESKQAQVEAKRQKSAEALLAVSKNLTLPRFAGESFKRVKKVVCKASKIQTSQATDQRQTCEPAFLNESSTTTRRNVVVSSVNR